jgi:Flp pilus assembly protein TadD
VDPATIKVCDPLADYYLGIEDYPRAIRQHQLVIEGHHDEALAYYHLGFAYGMIGDHRRELDDYQKAVALGLNNWELFLNLGLAYMEAGRLDSAGAVLRMAALMGPSQPQSHYNLGLVYERQGISQKAEQELLLSLRLDPNQDDARNELGVIYAEEGDYERAHREWADLADSNPSYTPSCANLAILKRVERGEIKGPRRLSGFAQAQ